LTGSCRNRILLQADRRPSARGDAFYIDQFNNPANPLAHDTSTAPEIWQQMGHRVDAIVCGVGSGGTITGLKGFFERVSPATEFMLADPKGSVLCDYIATFLRNAVEAIAGPFDSFLALRGVESLSEHSAITTHASIPAAQRAALGIDDTLIRLSVGIEALDDLKADLENGFAQV
jgi:cystathionine beta-synthase